MIYLLANQAKKNRERFSFLSYITQYYIRLFSPMHQLTAYVSVMPITFFSSCLLAMIIVRIINDPVWCTDASCLYYSFSSNMPFQSLLTQFYIESMTPEKKSIYIDNHNLACDIMCNIQNRKEKNKPLIIIIACIVIDNLSVYLYRRMLYSRIDGRK